MRLNAAQRANILAAVGAGRPGLVEDLDELLRGYEEARRKPGRRGYASAPPSATSKAARRIEGAARDLQKALDAAPEMLRQRIMVGTRARIAKGATGYTPDIFDDSLLDVAAVARELAKDARKVKARPGSKVDVLRRMLDQGVGAVLAKHGVPVKAYRAGAFKRVLAEVWGALGNRLPEDPLPRLQPVVRGLRKTR